MFVNKHPHTVSRKGTVLVIIDVQEGFVNAVPQFADVAANILRLTLTFQLFKMPILITEQQRKSLGSTVGLIKGMFPNWEVIERLECDCTADAGFLRQFGSHDMKNVVVCGIESHVSVNQTVLGFLQAGYRVHAVTDAMTSRHRIDHDAAILKMHQAGAIPATTELVLYELAGRAGTEEFCAIQRMLKSRPRVLESAPHAPAPTAAAAPAPAAQSDLSITAPSAPAQEALSQTTIFERSVTEIIGGEPGSQAPPAEPPAGSQGPSAPGKESAKTPAPPMLPESGDLSSPLTQTQILDRAVRKMLGGSKDGEGRQPAAQPKRQKSGIRPSDPDKKPSGPRPGVGKRAEGRSASYRDRGQSRPLPPAAPIPATPAAETAPPVTTSIGDAMGPVEVVQSDDFDGGLSLIIEELKKPTVLGETTTLSALLKQEHDSGEMAEPPAEPVLNPDIPGVVVVRQKLARWYMKFASAVQSPSWPPATQPDAGPAQPAEGLKNEAPAEDVPEYEIDVNLAKPSAEKDGNPGDNEVADLANPGGSEKKE